MIGDGTLHLAGVVLDDDAPLDGAMVVADDSSSARVRLGIWREDVRAERPDVEHSAACGFEATLDVRRSEPGPLRIALLVSRGGQWEEAAAVTVEVRPSAGGREGLRERAAFTIVHDEATMLPVWLAHGERSFEPGDLYVLDHGSSDGSTDDLDDRCHVIRVHREAEFDHDWLRSTVESFQAFLLRSYDTVVFTEVDELLVPDPRRYPGGLADYLTHLDRPAARATGFNLVHQPDEPPLDFEAPILAQRSRWHLSKLYSKRLVARRPLRWSLGFHEEFAAPDDPPDPDLLLVHLHRADRDACLARHRRSAAANWREEDVERGLGAQNLIAAPAEFDEWFYRGEDLDAPSELIPDHYRDAL